MNTLSIIPEHKQVHSHQWEGSLTRMWLAWTHFGYAVQCCLPKANWTKEGMEHCNNLSPCFETKHTIYRSENTLSNGLSTRKCRICDHTFFCLSLQLLHIYLQYQGLSIIRKNPISYLFAARYAHGVWKCYHTDVHWHRRKNVQY